MISAFAAVSLATLAGDGCQVQPPTTIPWSVIGWNTVLVHSQPFFCVSGRPLGPVIPPRDWVLVGYDYFWDPGTQPFPCSEKIDTTYRSAVKFDLTSLSGVAISAKLFYDTLYTRYPTMDTGTNITCAARLNLATEDWTRPGYARYFPSDDYQTLTPDQGSVDVTSAVNDWMQGRRPNDGFVFIGPDESYPEDTRACLSAIGNFRLVVQTIVRTPG